MTTTDVTFTPPELPVSAAETPEERDARLQRQVDAELAAIDDLVTLPQPVPVHTDNPPGAITFTTELWWYTGTDVVGEGPTPPPDVIPATGAIAGAPGTWTPSGSTPPADLAACAGITATPATAWTTGQHVITGDAAHVHWDSAAWVGGDAP